ncbi:cysteine synthase A [Haloplanus rubicundus]|uniref:Cysteine synthase A n=1 Tax=Haloplanus rubicundus TaxID=1547898 RepID=A0A345E9S1_9EURY|nr:cysteine synthase A [Haloplanus rubicundus]AXG08943.1 cysteine synthase A [Haloplanus rubicundus]
MSETAHRNVVESVEGLIGDTPLLRLDGVAENLLGKVEAVNAYSVKDRIAREMIDAAEGSGDLPPGGTVVEATSGNTGIGLATVAVARGYDCALTMPESMSEERRTMLAALGADLELTPAEEGMGGANRRAEELAAADDAVLVGQFENEANPRAHRTTTGPEIRRATGGDVDAVVAGVGTGGTITGLGEYFVERGDDVTTVAVEPASSPTITEACSDGHDIQGIGPGFLPDVVRTDLIDEVRGVTADEARTAARRLGREAGLLVGISSGAALAAATAYATEHPTETTVVILPDTGERYLSTDLFDA